MNDPSASPTGVPPHWEPVIAQFRALDDADVRSVDRLVARLFTADGRFESDDLPEPATGHAAIAARLRWQRTAGHRSRIRCVTEVQWAHRTARWCWAAHDDAGTRRGMDVVRLADDTDRIALAVRFSGLLPPPA